MTRSHLMASLQNAYLLHRSLILYTDSIYFNSDGLPVWNMDVWLCQGVCLSRWLGALCVAGLFWLLTYTLWVCSVALATARLPASLSACIRRICLVYTNNNWSQMFDKSFPIRFIREKRNVKYMHRLLSLSWSLSLYSLLLCSCKDRYIGWAGQCRNQNHI